MRRSTHRWLTGLLRLLVAMPMLALAQEPAPFAGGDPGAGAPLHQKDCIACHARLMGGDASRMYTRPERKVDTAVKLRAQVAVCNAQLATHYFPEEEEHIAAYLNLRYYHFKP